MGRLHVLERRASFLDPIHGLVRVTEEELAIIDAPIYQRLRHVKQNGLLYLVFPSATHTRFEHGLGTLHVANAMLEALVYNSEASRGKLSSMAANTPGRALDFSDVGDRALRDLVRITRIAALVHDLGHGPLSHSFDPFAPSKQAVATLLERDAALAPLGSLRAHLLDPKHKERGAPELRAPIDHEAMSCVFLCHALAGRDDAALLRAVSAALLGGRALDQVAEEHPLGGWLYLIHDLVASAPIDADRMDYLERDSRSCGVTYGLYDRNRLLKSMLCFLESDATSRPRFRLGWKRSGLRAVENFVQARFQLFAQVYYHKTNTAINAMLDTIGALARDARDSMFEESHARDVPSLASRYCELTDERFMRELCETKPRPIQLLARAIQQRRFYKRMLEGDKATVNSVMRLLERRGEEVAADELAALRPVKSRIGATKGLSSGAKLLELDRAGRYVVAPRATTWAGASRTIAALEQHDDDFWRLYLTEEVDRARRQELLALVREAAARYGSTGAAPLSAQPQDSTRSSQSQSERPSLPD
ncbi:MAG: HD domain-containing protein [Myxococcales bacterium]|nr:HD domain-containing protein [Myxococcales bacterium]MCB9754279.1 HD domain-containing protein [Myxococcales bacterium]